MLLSPNISTFCKKKLYQIEQLEEKEVVSVEMQPLFAEKTTQTNESFDFGELIRNENNKTIQLTGIPRMCMSACLVCRWFQVDICRALQMQDIVIDSFDVCTCVCL